MTSYLEGLSFPYGEQGDGFLLSCPYYGSFSYGLRKLVGMSTGGVAFGGVDPLSVDAVIQYEEVLLRCRRTGPSRICAVLLVLPHNPLDRRYLGAVLLAFMRLSYKY